MLDHTQLLNLHALLGEQRADVGSIRAIWSIRDRLALDADEEKAVELKRESIGGQERVVWNPTLSLHLKDFGFTNGEFGELRPRSRLGTPMPQPRTGGGWNPCGGRCAPQNRRYGAVGLVPTPDGGSESPIVAIQASHRAVSPDCTGRLAICSLQAMDLSD